MKKLILIIFTIFVANVVNAQYIETNIKPIEGEYYENKGKDTVFCVPILVEQPNRTLLKKTICRETNWIYEYVKGYIHINNKLIYREGYYWKYTIL